MTAIKEPTLYKQYLELLKSDRSFRRFNQSLKIERSTLEQLVELTRYCASARNLQPLRYRLVCDQAECRAIFPALKWAGYLPDWDGPSEGEQPVAYLIQCIDTELTANCLCDDGLQLQAIRLGASALGIGSCIIMAFNREIITRELYIPERYKPRYVLPLGYPAETVKIVNIEADGDIKYYRDSTSVHYVPKRPLEQLIIN